MHKLMDLVSCKKAAVNTIAEVLLKIVEHYIVWYPLAQLSNSNLSGFWISVRVHLSIE